MTETIVVFEMTPRWTPELQRQFVDESVRVRLCASNSEVLDEIETRRASVVVIQLQNPAAAALQLLSAILEKSRPVYSIVIGASESAELECPIRELGATLFLPEAPTGHRLARICRRHLRLAELPKA